MISKQESPKATVNHAKSETPAVVEEENKREVKQDQKKPSGGRTVTFNKETAGQAVPAKNTKKAPVDNQKPK
jgi:hypothetical protein